MIVFVLLLSVALIAHELGHLLAALAFRVRVSKFCLFFDPGFRWVDTGKMFRIRFCVGWLPFGAYVKFATAEEGTGNRNHLFENLHPGKRLVISLSGVIMNLLMAYLCTFIWVGNHADRIQDYSFTKHIVISSRLVNHEIVDLAASMYDDVFKKDNENHETKVAPEPAVRKSHAPKSAVRKSQSIISWNKILYKFTRINLLLFIFNLLPIPPLDGAQGLYSIYEYVFRKPLNITFQVIAGCIGIVVIIGSNIVELVKLALTFFN